jgi:hypothetical protein
LPGGSRLRSGPFEGFIKAPAEHGGRIKELRGELPVTVLVRPEPVAVVHDLRLASGKTVPLRPGLRCHIAEVSNQGPEPLLMVTLTSTSEWQYDPLGMRFEFVAEDGQADLVTARWTGNAGRPEAEALGLDAAPLLTGGGGIPWGGLALHAGSTRAPRSWILALPLPRPGKGKSLRQLRLLQFQEAHVSLPFVLSDIPLP